jgi:hypothetical protein
MTSRRRTPAVRTLTALAATATLLLAGCGDDPEPEATPTPEASESVTTSPSPQPSEPQESPEPSGASVHVTIAGDDVEPLGKTVEIAPGETVELHISSDRPGELHVHSSPEQEHTFSAGESVIDVKLDRPGQVDIEEHESEALIVRVLVR